MKRLLLLVVLVGAMLAVPSVSQGAANAYYWTPKTAAQALVDRGIQWRNGFHGIDYALCQGYGRYLSRGGASYFNNFSCYVEPDADDPYYIRLQVAGQASFRVWFLRYD